MAANDGDSIDSDAALSFDGEISAEDETKKIALRFQHFRRLREIKMYVRYLK